MLEVEDRTTGKEGYLEVCLLGFVLCQTIEMLPPTPSPIPVALQDFGL